MPTRGVRTRGFSKAGWTCEFSRMSCRNAWQPFWSEVNDRSGSLKVQIYFDYCRVGIVGQHKYPHHLTQIPNQNYDHISNFQGLKPSPPNHPLVFPCFFLPFPPFPLFPFPKHPNHTSLIDFHITPDSNVSVLLPTV